MEKPRLQAGDVFCVTIAGPLSIVIRAIEKFWAEDDKAEFGHAGIITGEHGATFEALSRCRHSNLDRYKGKHVLVARPIRSTDGGVIMRADKIKAIKHLASEHEGQWYPFWRLILHMLPPLPKYKSFSGRFLVCSEIVAKYEYLIATRQGPFTGINPDDLGDRWRSDKNYIILHDDTWFWGDEYGGNLLGSLQPKNAS